MPASRGHGRWKQEPNKMMGRGRILNGVVGFHTYGDEVTVE